MQRMTLKTVRKQHQLSPEEMGKIIGMSGSTYLRYEKNPQLLTVGQIWKLCNFFHMNIQELDLFANL